MRLIATHSPGFDPETPWEDRGSRTTAESRLFSQIAARRSSPHTAREHVFTRLICPDWVNVIAFTEAGELLVVEQYRHGIDASTQEIIGGVCEVGEEPLLSAQREVLEETGHATDHWVSLGFCEPNPAVQNNKCHFFLALGCREVAPLDLDPSEELRVWAYPWDEWQERMRSGSVTHALVLAAFLRLTLWEGWEAFEKTLFRP
ncbi:MAG: hydrolase [Holophagaceae bacterium]|nr:hydrolase [Holophagaceae bacterium]